MIDFAQTVSDVAGRGQNRRELRLKIWMRQQIPRCPHFSEAGAQRAHPVFRIAASRREAAARASPAAWDGRPIGSCPAPAGRRGSGQLEAGERLQRADHFCKSDFTLPRTLANWPAGCQSWVESPAGARDRRQHGALIPAGFGFGRRRGPTSPWFVPVADRGASLAGCHPETLTMHVPRHRAFSPPIGGMAWLARQANFTREAERTGWSRR